MTKDLSNPFKAKEEIDKIIDDLKKDKVTSLQVWKTAKKIQKTAIQKCKEIYGG